MLKRTIHKINLIHIPQNILKIKTSNNLFLTHSNKYHISTKNENAVIIGGLTVAAVAMAARYGIEVRNSIFPHHLY